MTDTYEDSHHDVYSLRARMIIDKHYGELKEKLGTDIPDIIRRIEEGQLPSLSPSTLATSRRHPPDISVGIIGAGPGGLYTAMILDSLGIDYTILEASPRVGGRLFTYHFDGSDPHQYYDIGAMRFPKTNIMQRLTNLFNSLGIRTDTNLIPYLYKANKNNGYLHYNGVRARMTPPPLSQTFLPQAVGVPEAYSKAGAQPIIDDALKPFIDALYKDLARGTTDGWKKVMLPKENYSMRSYLSVPGSGYSPSPSLGITAPLPTDVVNWLETFGGSTGGFDRGLTELVLGAMAFGAGENPEWYCIDGGSNVLATTMQKRLKKRVQFGERVNKIALAPSGLGVTLTTADNRSSTFSHVISTAPLPCLRAMDLSGCHLTPFQNNALRALQYGTAIKIGIQFSSAWWTTGTDKDGKPIDITGGQSYTDLPVRTVVYPSYGLNQAGDAVLMASYARSEDGARLGALIASTNNAVVTKDHPLAILVLNDLAAIHNVDFLYLYNQCNGLHGWNWSAGVDSMGAFAFFGPGSFNNLFTHLTQPAAGNRLHFAGEAISTRHAWVVGALGSAWRAVYELLLCSPTWRSKRQTFFRLWGKNEDWIVPKRGGYAGLPPSDEDSVDPRDDLLLKHLGLTTPSVFDD